MEPDFQKELAIHVSRNDIGSANSVIMQEVGRLVVHHRADFVDLLNNSDNQTHIGMTDALLVQLYMDNIHKKDLLVGTAFLVNIHNKTVGFNGESEVSDAGVKRAYKVLSSNFYGAEETEAEEEKSGFIFDTLLKGGVGITGKVLDAQHKKKYGALDAAVAQQKAKADIAKSIIAQRQSQIDSATKAKASKDKNLKLGLIVGGSVIAIAFIGLTIYLIKKN